MQKEKIIDEYLSGINIESILKENGCEEHEIRKILKDNKIDRNYNFFTDELYSRIASLYLDGKTQKKICYDLLISENGIKKTLLKKNISKRSFSQCNVKYSRDKYYFDNIDTPNKAYVLGLLYSDGNNFTPHNSITLSLQDRDKEVLEKIRKDMKYEGKLRITPLHSKNINYRDQYVLNINDEYLSKRLAELGVVDRKSLKLVFPTFLNDELLSHFVRGYFDGDGNIYFYKEEKMQVSLVGTYEFCSSLSSILLNFNCKNSAYHPRQCKDSNTFVIRTSGNKSSYKFLSWIYQDADFKINRKYNQYISFCKTYQVIS